MEKSEGLEQLNIFIEAIKKHNELDSFYEFFYYLWKRGESSGLMLHNIKASVVNLWIGSKFNGSGKSSLVLHFEDGKHISYVHNSIPLYKGQSTMFFEEVDIHFSIRININDELKARLLFIKNFMPETLKEIKSKIPIRKRTAEEIPETIFLNNKY
jgi:hypothetical protein